MPTLLIGILFGCLVGLCCALRLYISVTREATLEVPAILSIYRGVILSCIAVACFHILSVGFSGDYEVSYQFLSLSTLVLAGFFAFFIKRSARDSRAALVALSISLVLLFTTVTA